MKMNTSKRDVMSVNLGKHKHKYLEIQESLLGPKDVTEYTLYLREHFDNFFIFTPETYLIFLHQNCKKFSILAISRS